MKILIDTNFILSCVRNKIDFFRELSLMGFEILIPTKVIDELKKVENSKQKLKERDIARISLLILKKNYFKKIDLSGKYVDSAIRNYCAKNPDIIIATLDRQLKKLSNKKLIIKGKKQLEVIG